VQVHDYITFKVGLPSLIHVHNGYFLLVQAMMVSARR
jgi:hypothetical protein